MDPVPVIIKSLLATVAVSTIFGLLFPSNFLATFAIVTAIQVLFFIALNTYRDVQKSKAAVLEIAELSKQGLEVTCPCFKQSKQFIPIVLNDVNEYECDQCPHRVKVSISAETMIATVPVELENTATAIEEMLKSRINTIEDLPNADVPKKLKARPKNSK
jgi:hypothetical protein